MLTLLLACATEPEPQTLVLPGQGPVAWAPNGLSVAVGHPEGVVIWSLEGRVVDRVPLATTPHELALSDDRLAAMDDEATVVVDLDGAELARHPTIGWGELAWVEGRLAVERWKTGFRFCGVGPHGPSFGRFDVAGLVEEQQQDWPFAGNVTVAEAWERSVPEVRVEAQVPGGVRLRSAVGLSALSSDQHLVDGAVSPDGLHLAWTTTDGQLRIEPLVDGHLPDLPAWGNPVVTAPLPDGEARLYRDGVVEVTRGGSSQLFWPHPGNDEGWVDWENDRGESLYVVAEPRRYDWIRAFEDAAHRRAGRSWWRSLRLDLGSEV